MRIESEVQVTINELCKGLLKKYDNLIFSFDYNIRSTGLHNFNNQLPIHELQQLISKEKIFGLYLADEAYKKCVDLIYTHLVIGNKIPESQILLICASFDYKDYIKEIAKQYNKEPIRAEFASYCEIQTKHLFKCYMTSKFENKLLDDNINYPNPLLSNNHKKKYINFNRLWKNHRLALLCLLCEKNLLDMGYNSFTALPTNTLEKYYGDPNFFERQINDILNVYPEIKNHLKNHDEVKKLLPLHVDVSDFRPNLAWSSNRPLVKIFKDSYFSVVTETLYDNNHLRLVSEKTLRAILHKHPFIIASTPKILDIIKILGYKTFDGIIDESYDDELDDGKRLIKIADEVERLCSLTDNELQEFKERAIPIVEHNYKVLMEKENFLHTLI